MNSVLEYIKYRWNAKGRHGTHSPFIYDLVDNCFSIKIDPEFEIERKQLYSTLRSEKRTINIQDFGAGSKYLSNKRKISQIFQTSSSKGKFGDLLFQLARHYKPQNILEFGSSLGIGTIHLCKGHPFAKITTVEACEATRLEALKNYNRLGCSTIESVHSTFDQFLNNYSGEKFDLVFVDGHHDGDALTNYLKRLEAITHNDTIFILDDIRWSNSMFDAWNKIVGSSQFHVTIDLFRMGIVLNRHQQEKEHFIVKF